MVPAGIVAAKCLRLRTPVAQGWRLRAAGAIPGAIANMHELAFGTTSANAHFCSVPLTRIDRHRRMGWWIQRWRTAAAHQRWNRQIGIGTDTGDQAGSRRPFGAVLVSSDDRPLSHRCILALDRTRTSTAMLADGSTLSMWRAP